MLTRLRATTKDKTARIVIDIGLDEEVKAPVPIVVLSTGLIAIATKLKTLGMKEEVLLGLLTDVPSIDLPFPEDN